MSFDAVFRAKLTEAKTDPFVRVGAIHQVQDSSLHSAPCVKVTLSWIESREEEEEEEAAEVESSDIYVMELLIPPPLIKQLHEQLRALKSWRPPNRPGHPRMRY